MNMRPIGYENGLNGKKSWANDPGYLEGYAEGEAVRLGNMPPTKKTTNTPALTAEHAGNALLAMTYRFAALREVLHVDPRALHACEYLVRRLMVSDTLRNEVAEYAPEASAMLTKG